MAGSGAASLTSEELAEVWRSSREPVPSRRRGPALGRGGLGAVLRVGGLLMVLVTIAIMGVLGAKVVSSFSSDTSLSPMATPSTVAGAGAGPATAPVAATACAATRRTLEVAVQSFEAINGAPPADVQALVDAGLLDAAPPQFELVDRADAIVVHGTGECAGA